MLNVRGVDTEYSSDRKKDDGKPSMLTCFLLIAGIAFTAIGIYGLF